MNWISGIQNAIDYVEDNITDELDYEVIADKAFSSSFEFQRVFSIICGYTLGEYIRLRRLTLAGCELTGTNSKIIDVAMKYGYDSPESFTRAFVKFHGITPSQAKKDGSTIKSFSRLSVKLVLDGGNTMNYRVEKKDAFDIIVKKKEVSCNSEMTTKDISGFWAQCTADGSMQTICKYAAEKVFGKCIIGASFGNDASDKVFPYGIGAEYNNKPITDEGFSVETIPAHTYVIFKCVGQMPEAFNTLYKEIYTQFFTTSEYQPSGGIAFEAYPSDDVRNPDYTCEIWISVEKK